MGALLLSPLAKAYPLGTRTLCCQTSTLPRAVHRASINGLGSSHAYGMPAWLLAVIIVTALALIVLSVREFV